jgi:hypothetical protein
MITKFEELLDYFGRCHLQEYMELLNWNKHGNILSQLIVKCRDDGDGAR